MRSLGPVTAGVKLIDILTIYPMTCDHVSVQNSEKYLVQNRERYFTHEITLAKEASKTNEDFDFFAFVRDLATDGSTKDSDRPMSKVCPELFLCALLSTANMVVHIKVPKHGGGS